MKGKIPSIVTAIIAFAMVFSLVAAFTPATVAADATTDQINTIQMPNPKLGNLAYWTTPVALAQAADGTLFAGVRDDTYNDGNYTRWHVEQGNRQFAVFTSADGYKWVEGDKVPWNDNSPIVAIVPVPDYSKNNTVVYMATRQFVYVSTNGGKKFTQLDQVPGVTNTTAYITSMDIASTSTGYVVAVGTVDESGLSASGVFTYNEFGLQQWRDKQIGNDVYTTNKYAVYAVKFSTNYATDKVILALANTSSTNILTIRGTNGQWGVEALDATITAPITNGAKIVLPSDFNYISNPVSYVMTGSCVYRITSIQSPGVPSLKPLKNDVTFYDMAVTGTGSSTQVILATNGTTDTAGRNGIQVYTCTNPGGFSPVWVSSYKPPMGANDACLATGTLGTFIATDSDYMQPSGVSKMVIGANGNIAWNGVGLIDTVISTANYMTNNGESMRQCGPVWTVASPNNKVDQTIYMVTYVTNDDRPMMVWRTSNGGATWDMIAMEEMWMGEKGTTDDMFSDLLDDSYIGFLTRSDYIMTVQTSPTFSNSANSTDQTVYMMGEAMDKTNAPEWIMKSADAGNTWKPIIAMPAKDADAYISVTSWCVVNPTTFIVCDDDGYIYVTKDSGYSWTDGALTVEDGDINSLKFYNDATLGTVILAGVVDGDTCLAFISTDNGTTFTQIGTPLATIDEGPIFPLIQVDFDINWSTNHIVYAAFGGYFDVWAETSDETGLNTWVKGVQKEAGIARSTVNVIDPTASTLWRRIVSTSDFSGMLPAVQGRSIEGPSFFRVLAPTALEVGPQNTIYVTLGCFDSGLMAITWGGFIRCLDGTAATTSWGFVDSNLLGYGGLWTASVVPGSSNLFTIGGAVSDASKGGSLSLRLLNYNDTLGSKAGNMVPANGAKDQGTISGGNANVQLSWGGISGTEYKWQVALDCNFDSIVKEGTATTASAIVSGLALGTTYCWRVQASEPARGPWSAGNTFTTKSTTSGAPTLTSPANGDTISDEKPLFTWTAVTGATSYKIQVATDPGFTALVIDKTVSTNVYAATDKLSDSIYYWKVTATVGTDTTAPGSAAFTLSAASTTSGTPAWVWVLIVLGVVLAIFVLVLILRTRRPV